MGSYVHRFNAESLKVDIPDEKFAITGFIARLGVQSKDLMFSISKNPQASMAEVLAKAEKYINGEEALISKKGSSSTPIEKKARLTSNEDEAQRDNKTKRGPQKRPRTIPEKKWKPQRPPKSTSAREATTLFTSAVYSFDGCSFAGPARGATRTVPEVAVSYEVRPSQKG